MAPKKRSFAQLTAREVWTHPVPTVEEVRQLPVSVQFAHAARALGYGMDQAYRVIDTPSWPEEIPLRKIGQGRRCLRAHLLRYLGIEDHPEPVASEAAR